MGNAAGAEAAVGEGTRVEEQKRQQQREKQEATGAAAGAEPVLKLETEPGQWRHFIYVLWGRQLFAQR